MCIQSQKRRTEEIPKAGIYVIDFKSLASSIFNPNIDFASRDVEIPPILLIPPFSISAPAGFSASVCNPCRCLCFGTFLQYTNSTFPLRTI